MKIKTAMRCHFTFIMMAMIFKDKKKDKKTTCVGEDVEKQEPLSTAGGNVKSDSHYGKQHDDCKKKN